MKGIEMKKKRTWLITWKEESKYLINTDISKFEVFNKYKEAISFYTKLVEENDSAFDIKIQLAECTTL